MSREWQPGDVAMIHIPKSSAPGYGVNESGSIEIPAVRNASGGWSALSNPEYFWAEGYSFHKSEPRPLAVIDPENREQVDRLLARYLSIYDGMDAVPSAGEIASMQAALREFANPTPPKPDEPTGLGAVVEDESGTKWIRHDSVAIHRCWLNTDDCDTRYRAWDEINVVHVHSEGVTP